MSIQQWIDPSSARPIYLPICLPTHRSSHRSIYPVIDRSIYLPISRLVHRPSYRSIYLSIGSGDGSMYRLVDLPTDRSLDRCCGHSINLSIDRSIYRSIYRSIHPSVGLFTLDPWIDLSVDRSIALCRSIDWIGIARYMDRTYIHIELPVHRLIRIPFDRSIKRFTDGSIYPSIQLSSVPWTYLSIYLCTYM